MVNRQDFSATLKVEIDQAASQRFKSECFHSILILLNILLGGTATYLAALGYEVKAVIALITGLTTIAGTLEKTFGFGRAKSGFRKVKTQFQSLENDLMKFGDDEEIPDAFVDRLNEIRQLKVELTDKS